MLQAFSKESINIKKPDRVHFSNVKKNNLIQLSNFTTKIQKK